MTVVLSELPRSLAVDPGQDLAVTVRVRNASEIVDEYVFEVLGPAADWTLVAPQRVSLLPGMQEDVTLTFRPPRVSTLEPGELAFALKASSLERAETTAVVEGTLDVQPFGGLSLELVPRTSHSAFAAKHEVALDNRGNHAVEATLSAGDPDDLLRFRFKPPVLQSAPGTATFATLHVSHRKRFFRGPAKPRPFVVSAHAEGEEDVTANGNAMQERMIPNWAAGLVVGLAAIALIWAFFLQPKIKDEAQAAAVDQVNKVAATPAASTTASGSAQGASAAHGTKTASSDGSSTAPGSGSSGASANASPGSTAAAAAKPAGTAAAGAGAAAPTGPARALAGTPSSTRLHAACAKTCTARYVVPAGKEFAVTDLLLGNPSNTHGTLTVSNGGSIITVEDLDNFRDLDYHLGTPIIVGAGKALTLSLKCLKKPCSAAGFFTGTLTAHAPKLLVTQSLPDVVDAGAPFAYGIAATNTGDLPLFGVVVEDQLPDHTTFNGFASPVPTTFACKQKSNLVTCKIAVLQPGDSASVTANVKAAVDKGGITLVNRVTGTSVRPATKSVAASTTKVAATDLAVHATATATAAVGQPVTYSITITNQGQDPASAVNLTDTVPTNLTGVTVDGLGCAADSGAVSCDLGDMEPGDTRTIEITGMAATAGSITDQPTVTSPTTTDTDPSNNDTTAPTTITP